MAFQFVHLETYARKADSKGRSTRFVLAEAQREAAACLHVSDARAPIVIFGMPLDQVEQVHDEAAEAARTTPNGGKPRKIRIDQHTLLTVVASHPYTVEEVRVDAVKQAEVARWEELTVKWLRDEYGNALASVVRHEDETHWHLHAYVLPSEPAMRAAVLHPGQAAKTSVMLSGPDPDEDKKALNRRGDAAYRSAMREWQNSYHEAVAARCGLTRLGPQRRRLTRAQWHAEKVQATALKAALDRSGHIKRQADLIFHNSIIEAQNQIAKATAKATAIETMSARAKADATQQVEQAKAASAEAEAVKLQALAERKTASQATVRAKQEIEKARKATARLQYFPSLFRLLWDSFRISKVQERILRSVEAEMDGLRRRASTASIRAKEAEAERKRALDRARVLDRALAEVGAQRDNALLELARLREEQPGCSFSHGPRPKK